MGWPLPGEYGHAWTAPAGAGYGAMATVAGVRVPLGERRKTYDDEVLLSRVNTRRSPGDEGLGGEEGASGEGAAAIEVEEAQPAPVMLKSRASSGELGLLFDQAIRNAENQAEEQLRSGTAMGTLDSVASRGRAEELMGLGVLPQDDLLLRLLVKNLTTFDLHQDDLRTRIPPRRALPSLSPPRINRRNPFAMEQLPTRAW